MSPSDPQIPAALRASHFAQRLLNARPHYAEEVARAQTGPWTAADMRAFLAPAEGVQNEEDAARHAAHLRELRGRVLLRIVTRDLTGLADLEEVTGCMSDLAECCLQSALQVHAGLLALQHGAPSAPLLVVGMGKLGGRELNVSSDIDLIFLFSAEGQTSGPRPLSHQEFHTLLGQRLIRALHDVNADGQVFRVDMRLRPWGDAGALVCSFDALEQYFIAHGREWERYAWIKARVVAGGDPQSIAALDQLVRPFVFRKYLDYGSFAAVRALHAQIRQEVARRELSDDIKLGPGGIREIEFIAQALQLVRGGRDSSLREKPTQKVLQLLAAKGFLDQSAANELCEAYRFLRRLEHRLQYLDDAQTHRLPEHEPDQALIAEAMGYADWAVLREALEERRARVTLHFDNAVADKSEGQASPLADVWLPNIPPEAAAALLQQAGFADGVRAFEQLRTFRAGHRYRALPPNSQLRLDALIPRLLEAVGHTAHPDAGLGRVLDFVDLICRRSAYIALLQESPRGLKQVAELLSSSTWAASYLLRHPVLLDEMLDARRLHAPPDWSDFLLSLRREMAAHEGDTERQMDLLRELHHAQVFRLLTQDLAGVLSVERLADHLSIAADLLLSVVVEECWKQVRNRHCEMPRIAVIAYGKLGGKELGYASDLDLVYVYDDPHAAAPENYAKLVQRINTWLSSHTAAGTLFETDLRLRPNGDAGLLASSMQALRDYQFKSAWTWEHQALTRARFVTGDAAVGQLFEALRRDILIMSRDVIKLRADVLEMRRKMAAGHPNRSQLFDVKHDPGGMVDIEFLVQYLVLAHAHEHYELTANLGNIALLHIAGALKLIPNDLADHVANAYRTYRRLQHKLRLNGADYARVDQAEVAQDIEATRSLWGALFGN